MSLPKTLVIDPHWDPVPTGPNSIFLDNIYGQHRRIRNASPLLCYLLQQLTCPRNSNELIESVLGEFGASSDRVAVQILFGLLKQKIVRDYFEIRRPDLTPDDNIYERFAPQISWFAGTSGSFDLAHQAFARLRQSRVVVIGLGGAGSLLAQMLTAAGIGELVLVDGDTVDQSNLSRQILYTSDSALHSEPKVLAMQRMIRSLSPFTSTVIYNEYVSNAERVEDIIMNSASVALTADSPRIKLQRSVNSAAVKLGIPLIYSLVGQIGPYFIPGKSACFKCLERHWTKNDDLEHNSIVEGHSNLGRREIPATVLASAKIAGGLCAEIISYLGNATRCETINRIVNYSSIHGSEYENCSSNRDCICNIWHRSARRPR